MKEEGGEETGGRGETREETVERREERGDKRKRRDERREIIKEKSDVLSGSWALSCFFEPGTLWRFIST